MDPSPSSGADGKVSQSASLWVDVVRFTHGGALHELADNHCCWWAQLLTAGSASAAGMPLPFPYPRLPGGVT